MDLTSADQFVILLVLLATVACFALVRYLQQAVLLRGFSSIAGDLRVLRTLLRGNACRKGGDFLIRGNYRGVPARIRFSRSENAPALNIQIRSQARFNLYIAPLWAHELEGRVQMPVSHPLLGSRCSVRTDHLPQARNLLQAPLVADELWNLCCSSQASVSIANGIVEFNEAQLPTSDVAGTISRHLASLVAIAATAQGRSTGREAAVSSKRRPSPVAIGAIIVVLLCLVLLTFVAVDRTALKNRSTANRPLRSEIPASDAAHMFGVGDWRLVQPADFDSRAVAWAADKGVDVAGRIVGHFGPDGKEGVAYVLVDPQTRSKRLLILVGGAVKFNQVFPDLALAVRVPRVASAATQWQQPPDIATDADGILVLPNFDDRSAATVVYVNGLRTASAAPKDYRSLYLQ